MKGKVSKIKNTKGELALPITTVEAVYMEDGTTILNDEIKNINSSLDNIIQEKDGKKVKIVACALRNDGTGWKFLNDENHVPIGVQEVVTNQTQLELKYSFNVKKVISLVATPDETFANMGIICGASVGLTSAKIQFSQLNQAYAVLKNDVNGDIYSTQQFGIKNYSWNDDNKTLRINYDKNKGVGGISLLNRDLNVNGKVTIYNETFCEIQFFRVGSVGAYVKYHGGLWDLNNLQGINEVTFNDGVLILKHNECVGCDISVSVVDDNVNPSKTYDCKVLCSPNEIRIRFFDNDGNHVMVADENMKVFVSRRSFNNPIKPAIDECDVVFSKNSSNEILNPNEISAEFGNVWVYGIFEVD